MSRNQDSDDSEMSDGDRGIVSSIKENKRKIGKGALLVSPLVLIFILFFPVFQSLIYELTFARPSVVQWTVIGTGMVIYGFYGSKPSPDNTLFRPGAFVVGGAIVVVIVGLFIGPFAGQVYTKLDLQEQVAEDKIEMETLPETATDNVRITPRSVADNYAQSSIQLGSYGISESDITYRNESYAYSYAIEPDNLAVAIMGEQFGAAYADMTVDEKSVTVNKNKFKNGRNLLFIDSHTYQSVLDSPFKRHNFDNRFNANPNADTEPYIAHPTTEHNIKFKLFPLPQVYSVPELSSVKLMDQQGNIETLSPEEAANDERLKGQNYYPYDLALKKIRATKFRNGVFNKWFSKRGVLQIADLPEEGNSWPLTVPMKGDKPQLEYFVATEPANSGSGIFEVWVVDSQTGQMKVQKFSESQDGPEKAVNAVKQNRNVNRLSSADVVAPVPIVKDGTLYWHTKVISDSKTGIIYTAFVNSKTREVTLVESTSDVYAFLSEEELNQVKENQDSANQSGPDSNTETVTVVITDNDGEITGTENITVPEGGNIQVEIPNGGS